MSTAEPRPSWPGSYWRQSRAHRYSLLFALPLLLVYEALATVLNQDPAAAVRNGADVILKGLFIALAGAHGPLIFGALLIAVSVWLVGRDMRARGGGARLQPVIFGVMLGESVLLALTFGLVVGGITSRLLAPFGGLAIGAGDEMGSWMQLMISLGAGLYEELLFRVIIVSVVAFLGTRVLGWRPAPANVVAAVTSALIFSAFHYVGPYGDSLELPSFTFRLIAGLFFSGLFVLRGFGITAWTHALYDVFLLT